MKVKLMTFNLRIANAGDGINAFDNRKERVKETIMYESPDVVGFQEASDGMIDWIKVAIRSKYVVVGTGRNADRTGEGARIAFKKKKFELVSLETIWLSETPNIPGSCYSVDQSTCPRVFTAIELMDRDAILNIAVYPGHPEGDAEGKMIEEYLSSLSRHKVCATKVNITNSPTSPYFFMIETKA